MTQVSFNLAGGVQPENIEGEAVSPNFLSLMGVQPFLGRNFDASEEQPGSAPVVMLSYALWQSHFGGEAAAVGRTITLDSRVFTVIGVLPPEFRSLDKADVIEPIGAWATGSSKATARNERGDMVVVGRLAPAASLEQARAEMEGIALRLERAYPEANAQCGVALRPIREVFVSDIRPAVLVLFGAVMFVLLIACANVANLFLMRSTGRAREIALRIAIGASRGRIVRQMLVESFLLASLGGALGLLMAYAGIHAISTLVPRDMLPGPEVSLNGAVLLFAAGVVALSTLMFGLAPALHSAKADLQTDLKEGSRTAGGSTHQNRWRDLLVIAEVSLALILLVGAGLMMKSLNRLLSVDPGFHPERVLTMKMSLNASQYGKRAAILNFWQQTLERVRSLPGVDAVALGTVVPLTDDHSRSDITLEGMPLPNPGSFPHPDVHIVSSGYVRALGIPLLRGRIFTESDTEDGPRVALINSMVAGRFFANEDPVGRRFVFGAPSGKQRWITIVGVVADTKLYGLANPSRLEVYLPYRQSATDHMNLIVKSGIEPASLTSAIRNAVASVDKDQPVFDIATMQQLVGNSVATRRLTLILLSLFSALAMLLAAIGIYGVISYSVAQRIHEIGIRMALGAQRSDVLRMIFAQGVKIAGAGLAIGILASLGLTRLMASLLFSVSAVDPPTFLAVAIVLALISMLACYIPARRTLRVDPMIALRYE